MLSAKNIQNGRIRFDELRLLSPDDFEIENRRTNISAGDILLTIVGALGRTAVVAETHAEFTLQRSVAVLKSEAVNPHYLRNLLDSPVAQTFFLENAKGTAQKGIYLKALGGMEVPIAPFAEQTRIAQKLEELLVQVDTLKARIDAIPALIKRFRRSVLAAAISRRLTKEWTVDPQNEWSYERAENVCEKVQSGGTPKEGFALSGIPFLKVYNIVNQKIDFDYRPQYISEVAHRGPSAKSIARPGDVLMNIVGPPLGKIATIPVSAPEWNINQAISLFRPSARILSGWITIVLEGGDNLRNIINETKGSAGQVNISLSQCRSFIFPVPSIEEQNEIVHRVEQLFAFADQLETKVASAKSRIDKLNQSILAKAFRGELVPQDPNDELASVLLERIRAQRAVAPKAKRS
jgi:type I restriction enzyme S subunit